MKITITHEGNVTKVSTVDGTFSFTPAGTNENTSLDFDSSKKITISELIQNVFNVTRNDQSLIIEEKVNG